MLVTPVVVLAVVSAISVNNALTTSQLTSQLFRSNQLHKKQLFNQLFKFGYGDLDCFK